MLASAIQESTKQWQGSPAEIKNEQEAHSQVVKQSISNLKKRIDEGPTTGQLREMERWSSTLNLHQKPPGDPAPYHPSKDPQHPSPYYPTTTTGNVDVRTMPTTQPHHPSMTDHSKGPPVTSWTSPGGNYHQGTRNLNELARAKTEVPGNHIRRRSTPMAWGDGYWSDDEDPEEN